MKGLSADVVFLNEHPVSYLDEMQEQLTAVLDDGPWSTWKYRPGGAYLLRADQMGHAERVLLETVARAILRGDRGDLRTQLDRPHLVDPLVPAFAPTVTGNFGVSDAAVVDAGLPAVTLSNGLGGFADDGKAYVVVLNGTDETPMPWTNVIANPRFGTMITASGSAHTWSANSRENRLTPFANDPTSDPTAEALFIRDEESGDFWSPTPGPLVRTADSGRVVVRHTAGLTHFSRHTHGISHALDFFVDTDDPVKFSLLTLGNDGDRARTLSVFAYNEWVLGPPRDGHQRHVVTELDAATGAIFARNAYNQEWAQHVAFSHASETPVSVTGDRCSFIGRNGELSQPIAMQQAILSGQLGGALDPCAALQVKVVLQPGERRRLVFLLGEGTDHEHAARLIARHGHIDAADSAVDRVQKFWNCTLDAITCARRTTRSMPWSIAGCCTRT